MDEDALVARRWDYGRRTVMENGDVEDEASAAEGEQAVGPAVAIIVSFLAYIDPLTP